MPATATIICQGIFAPFQGLAACPSLSGGIAAGVDHTVTVKSNSTVWVWGDYPLDADDAGTTPILKNGISNVVAVAAGYDTRYALKADGTIWGWGLNDEGQLGDGTTVVWRETPVQASGLSGMKTVAAGRDFVLSLRSDGTVWAWGSEAFCVLGFMPGGGCLCQPIPRQISGFFGVIAVAAGSYHCLAIKCDGTVWAWGSNNYGELGYDTPFNNPACIPSQINGLTGVRGVRGGFHHSLALKSDGTVWSWGYNSKGQLGDGTTANRIIPGQVAGLTAVAAVATGPEAYHNLALKFDGTVWAWGANDYGQLGDGSTTDRHTPVRVVALNGVVAIAAARSQSFAVRDDGSVWAWGYNGDGQLGNSTTSDSHTPIQVSQATGLTSVAGPFVWVDFNYVGIKKGTFTMPYNTLTEALNSVPAVCGTVFIKPGHTNATPTLSKAMRIEDYGGTVIIGR